MNTDAAKDAATAAVAKIRENAWLFYGLQVGVGLAVVAVAYYVSLSVLHEESLVYSKKSQMQNPKQKTLVVDGFLESSLLSGRQYTTVNPLASGFVPMPRAFNRMGGSQFSYSFWLFMGDASKGSVRNKDIFVRGDTREYRYEKSPIEGELALNGKNGNVERDTDILIKAPRLRFGETFSDLVLEFNTHDDINHKVHLDSQESDLDHSIRHNLMSLIQKKWVMLTLTFEDNVPVSEFENGIVVRFFVNDILYHTHRVTSTLRQNNGDLYMFPNGEVEGCRIGNFAYYNYALAFKDVKALHEKGKPTKRADRDRDPIGLPLYLSEYNKLDLYNR